MNIEQFKEARAKLGRTQEGLARDLGVSVFTVNRWECGGRSIPGPVELAMRYLLSRRRRRQT